jgi:putative SOS response-associated peptidase YedK
LAASTTTGSFTRTTIEPGLQRFTIIIATPDKLAATADNRMPAILHLDDYQEWLMRVNGESPPAHLLRASPAERMKAKETYKDVENVHVSILSF